MALAERIPLYAKLEELRKRPLMVYVTSSRPNAQGLMASDAVPELLPSLVAQLQINVVPIPPVDYQLVHAIMESPRVCSRFTAEGKIFAARMPDLQLRVSVVQTGTGWKAVTLTEEQKAAASRKKPGPSSKKKTEG
jgi:hypothetical protein